MSALDVHMQTQVEEFIHSMVNKYAELNCEYSVEFILKYPKYADSKEIYKKCLNEYKAQLLRYLKSLYINIIEDILEVET